MTVVTVKILYLNFTDLPSPDFDKAFCNALSAGDGNSFGDDKKSKWVTVDLRRVSRFERGFTRDRVNYSPSKNGAKFEPFPSEFEQDVSQGKMQERSAINSRIKRADMWL